MLTIAPDLSGVPSTWSVSFDPATGVLSYTAPADNTGALTIPVTVTDDNGGTFTGSIVIQPVNPGPDAVDDGTPTAYGVPVIVAVTANDSDPDSDPLVVVAYADGRSGPGQHRAGGQRLGVHAGGRVLGRRGDHVHDRDQDGRRTPPIAYGHGAPTRRRCSVDPTPGVPGTPEVDPTNPANLLVPATDGVPLTLPLADYFADPNTAIC